MSNCRATVLMDTAAMMGSGDYKERFKAEYIQTKIRYGKLHDMCVKYEAGTLDFTPSCSLELLKEQKAAMGNYLHCLEVRAQIEEIELSEPVCVACTTEGRKLAEYAAGDTVKIGDFEMVVLEQREGETALILKGFYGDPSEFGEENNRYDGSYVDEKCQAFAQELAEKIGWDNIVLHEVDLTSDDGLKDYGVIQRRASLITTDLYRKFVDILDMVKPDRWWWLATPHSTKRHENDAWIKCVAPSGDVDYDDCYFDIGVRPFCILKSTIFVSD